MFSALRRPGPTRYYDRSKEPVARLPWFTVGAWRNCWLSRLTKLLPQMLLVEHWARIGWYQSEEQMAASRAIRTRFAAA